MPRAWSNREIHSIKSSEGAPRVDGQDIIIFLRGVEVQGDSTRTSVAEVEAACWHNCSVSFPKLETFKSFSAALLSHFGLDALFEGNVKVDVWDVDDFNLSCAISACSRELCCKILKCWVLRRKMKLSVHGGSRGLQCYLTDESQMGSTSASNHDRSSQTDFRDQVTALSMQLLAPEFKLVASEAKLLALLSDSVSMRKDLSKNLLHKNNTFAAF